MNDIAWKTINRYFNENPNILLKHHLDSYNDFFSKGIINIFKNTNPIRLLEELDEETQQYKYECNLYFGGKEGNKIYYGKPIIYDRNSDGEDREHYMFPNEARLRNMTYAFTIHYDIYAEFTLLIENNSGETGMNKFHPPEIIPITLEKIYLGKFPIMLQSDLCILKNLDPEVRYNMGECRNDKGGYFIISGKEKVIISQEGRANNILYVKDSFNDIYSHAAEIRSVSEDPSKPIRTLSVRIVTPRPTLSNNQIVVNIPNVRKPIPLFILMRALGVISDYDIIKTCLLDIDKNDSYIELFRPSIHDAGNIFTQTASLKLIATFTKGKSISSVMQILSNYFLPHIGELNFKSKALFLGYMVKKLLSVFIKHEKPTNRDSYRFKRIEISGILIYQLFREYFLLQQKNIYLKMDKEYYYKKNKTAYQKHDFVNLLLKNKNKIFENRIVEEGFKKAFKGNWGAEAHTKRIGAAQDLNRLSFFGFMCQLRKTNLPIAADGAKILAPRLLNGTQFGYLCPIHSPDGGNVGLHKHMSISTHITTGCSMIPYVNYLRKLGIKLLEECSLDYLSKITKVFINGNWVGATSNPIYIIKLMKLHRRNNMIDVYTSIRFDYKKNEIQIWCDGGRAMRPLFYMQDGELSFEREKVLEKYMNNKITWGEIMYGFSKKEKITETCNINIDDVTIDNLKKNAAVIEYIDTEEGESNIIGLSTDTREQYNQKRVTHVEIHPSMILGIMANQIIFPENNPYPRNAFSCGQSKQAVSIFHSNFNNRIDKSAFILNNGQIPLTKSRYLKYTTNEEHPYGENTIVAIMCYTGYNTEDAVIFNEASLRRGLFRTTYYNSYETHEEVEKVENENIETIFLNPLNNNVIGLKPGYDYSKLDDTYGIIKENELVDEKTVLIGKGTKIFGEDKYSDASIIAKKGQVGYVDKAFITQDDNGKRIAKIRIRAERVPAIGDKFCSRAGQKGTMGIILREIDMPTTASGLRPDIIVNPHAMPSRMTIGHLVESLTCKVSCLYGAFSDCTAFTNTGPKDKEFGKLLVKEGYHSSGCEYLYNGMTGEQLETEIYIGPTYYLRLKHMPKDKINYRARGPRTVLTRQTVQGRANNGGLRIGEMDRDCLIAHGLNQFIKESMLVRGDEFYMAVCNKTGCIAAYNESKNLFLSPMADGPIQFIGNLDDTFNVVNITKYGRDFSVIRIPYAFKLLMQELKTMNIQMRIITEKNVDQLLTLNGTNNIFKLTGLNSLEELSKDTRSKEANAFQSTKPSILSNLKNEETEQENPFDMDFYNQNSGFYNQFTNEGEWEIPTHSSTMIAPHMMEPQWQTPVTNTGVTDVYYPGKYVKYNGEKWKIVFNNEEFNELRIESLDKSKTEFAQYTEVEPLKDDDDITWSPSEGIVNLTQQGLTIKKPIETTDSTYQPTSPAYDPNKPPSAPTSPAYDPNKPPSAPTSPAYDPHKPPSAPTSPAYDPNKPSVSTSNIDRDMSDDEEDPWAGGGDDKLPTLQIGGDMYMKVPEPPEIKITRNTISKINEGDLNYLGGGIEEEESEVGDKNTEEIKKII